MTIPLVWRPAVLDEHDPQAAVRDLNRQLGELGAYVEALDQAVRFGPLPGAYLSVDLGAGDPAGLTPGVVDLSPISFQARIVAFYGFVLGGQLTVMLNNDITDVLAANTAIDSSGVDFHSRTDFAVESVYAPNLNLEIISVDSGTPTHIRCHVLLKNVQKVEPA